MKYISRNNHWSFGISLSQNKFCGGKYTEYELRIDFWKWSIGVVL